MKDVDYKAAVLHDNMYCYSATALENIFLVQFLKKATVELEKETFVSHVSQCEKSH